jgi:long-chain acyl-CoA synthetase
MQGTSILNQAVATQPHRIATICGQRERTWREVGQRVPKFAAALRGLGISDGARVAALAMNSDRYIELFYAVPWAGGVFAPLNIRWSVAESAGALRDSEASILIVDDAFAAQGFELKNLLPSIEVLIFAGEGELPPGMLSYEDLIEDNAAIADANRKDEDLCCIFYTGGTTSHPKGVAMSHKALVFGTMTWLAVLPEIEDLTFLYVGGFFHFSGAAGAMYVTMAGGTHVVLPKFEAVPVMQAIGAHKVTNAVLVPTMVTMLLNHPDFHNYDLTSLKTCIYGGSPMPETLIKEAMMRLPSWRFYQIYGMTETCGYATMLRWRDHYIDGPHAARLRAAGQPVPGMSVRIMRPDGSFASEDELGEIVMRGDSLMSGYLNNREATDAVLIDGWMHSGDAGTIDGDGFLFVIDRIKDMVVTGGENVYSVEVERALFAHPAVREAAVIGIPSERWGEAVHGVVVLRDGAEVTAEELMMHCRNLIGGYKVPRSIEFRDEPLPVTPVGKVRKNVLRDPHWENFKKKI